MSMSRRKFLSVASKTIAGMSMPGSLSTLLNIFSSKILANEKTKFVRVITDFDFKVTTVWNNVPDYKSLSQGITDGALQLDKNLIAEFNGLTSAPWLVAQVPVSVEITPGMDLSKYAPKYYDALTSNKNGIIDDYQAYLDDSLGDDLGSFENSDEMYKCLDKRIEFWHDFKSCIVKYTNKIVPDSIQKVVEAEVGGIEAAASDMKAEEHYAEQERLEQETLNKAMNSKMKHWIHQDYPNRFNDEDRDAADVRGVSESFNQRCNVLMEKFST